MNRFKNIEEMMESWGRGKRSVPPGNLLLKNKVLSKIPFVRDEVLQNSSLPRHSLPWTPLALAALSILVFISGSFNSGTYTQTSVTLPTAPSVIGEEASYPETATTVSNQDTSFKYGYDGGSGYGLPITDTREFLKTYYNASVRTRNVNDTMEKIEIIARGLGGRIDYSSGGEEYGYINYSIPAGQLEMFKREIKELTGRKLFTEQVSSENLLPQKQAIEEEKKQAEGTIEALNKERAQIVNTHQKTSRSYELRIASIQEETRMLEAEWPNASPERRNQITSRLIVLNAEKDTINGRLANENKSYRDKLASVDQRIRSSKSNLEYANVQDRNLMADVATVSGSISLSWISLWGIADAYAPGPLLAWLILLAAALLYLRHITYRRIDLY